MKGWLALAGGLLSVLVLATPVHADFARLMQGGNPTAEAMVVDPGTTYVGQSGGTVLAIDRATEQDVWSHDFTATYGAGTRVLDMVAEPQGPLYVALSIAGNGHSEPVVALDRATGSVVWDTYSTFRDAGVPHFSYTLETPGGAVAIPLDPYRLALDQGRDSPYLWVGTEHGAIVQLLKATGAPSLDEGGHLRMLIPSFPDDRTLQGNAKCLRESGIYALSVFDGQLWAARNFGGEDKTGQCANPLLTNIVNMLYRLDADHLVDAAGNALGNDDLAFPDRARLDPIDPATCTCPDGRRFAAPAILDVWVDSFHSNATDQAVYLAGSGTSTVGVFVKMHATGPPTATAPFPDIQAYTRTNDNDKNAEFGPGTPPITTITPPTRDANYDLGDASIGAAIRGDGQDIYATTWINKTAPNTFAPGGWILKLDPNTLRALDGPSDWRHHTAQGNLVDGRTFTAGDADSLWIEPGPAGKVIVGHGSIASPYPAANGIGQRTGALLVEVPKDSGPVVVQLLPAPGAVVPGQYPVAFRTDYPVDAARADLTATVQYGHGLSPSSWSTLPNFSLPAVNGNTYSVSGNVPMQGLPEAMDLRLRMRVASRDGHVATDMSDGLLGADRQAPVISGFGIIAAGQKVPHSQTDGNPPVRSQRPLFFVDGSDAMSDVDTYTSRLWIDDPSHAYPFLVFGHDAGGRVTGFTFDMAGPNAYGNLPSGLTEGPHVIHAELVDKAGNFDYKEWTIVVDSQLAAPTFLPPDGTWTASAAPTWVAQFHEDVQVVSAKLDGQDLPASAIALLPQHPTQNPDGARVTVTAPAAMASGHTAQLELWVADQGGNQAGPFTSTLRLDTQAPAIDRQQPAAGDLVGDDRPTLTAYVTDALSGLAQGSIHVWLDGNPQSVQVEGDRVDVTLQAPLASGTHTVLTQASDVAGNLATTTRSFTVDAAAPHLAARVLLPDGQVAAKRGDLVQIEALVVGPAINVTVDARGLGLAAPVLATRQADGRYLVPVTVAETRSGDFDVLVTAVDAAGHSAVQTVAVPLDNQPPVAFMKELPARVAGTFELSWSLQGDTGAPAYTIVESRVGNGTWQVVAARQGGTRMDWTPVPGQALLSFRVTVVDGAGNRQATPSNTVQTETVDSPIDTIILPQPWVLGQSVRVSLAPVAAAQLLNVTADISLPDGASQAVRFVKVGNVFVATAKVDGSEGGGSIDLLLQDAQGQTRVVYPVTFVAHPLVAPQAAGVATKGAPWPGLAMLVAGLGLAAILRRHKA